MEFDTRVIDWQLKRCFFTAFNEQRNNIFLSISNHTYSAHSWAIHHLCGVMKNNVQLFTTSQVSRDKHTLEFDLRGDAVLGALAAYSRQFFRWWKIDKIFVYWVKQTAERSSQARLHKHLRLRSPWCSCLCEAQVLVMKQYEKRELYLKVN